MEDTMDRYTDADRSRYTPPPCPNCGGATVVEWVDITLREDLNEPHYTPGYYRCASDCLGHTVAHLGAQLLAARDELGPWNDPSTEGGAP